jgi:hypothetical protein
MGSGLIAAAVSLAGLFAVQAVPAVPAKLAFEAASVKANTSGERSLSAPRFQGTTFTALNVPVERDSGVDIFGAVRQQFGLKLEPDRAPFEVLVVESVKRPTPN